MFNVKIINAQCRIDIKGPYKIGGVVFIHDNTTVFNSSNARNRSSDLCEAIFIEREESRIFLIWHAHKNYILSKRKNDYIFDQVIV